MSASSIGRVWLIAGPTASGKSALAMRLARAVGGEIVNADSMQLYRDLRVLTARPSIEDEAALPHHLYGIADASQAWSVGKWLRAARAELATITERGGSAVVVGGTGLYFRALTQGLADIPAIPEEVRTRSAAAFETLGEAAFRERLGRDDPQSAATIAPNDRLRLVRAWEVVQATGRPIVAWRADAAEPPLAPGSYQTVVLDPPRAELYRRCDARIAEMIARGALDEVAAIMARGLDPELSPLKALGLRPLARHLSGEFELDEAISLASQETRRYAKRQTTWFRHQCADWPRITALDAEAQWSALAAWSSPRL